MLVTLCCFIISVGYTNENIDINWKKTKAVEITQLELAQFRLSQDVTTTEYSETYESTIRLSYYSILYYSQYLRLAKGTTTLSLVGETEFYRNAWRREEDTIS